MGVSLYTSRVVLTTLGVVDFGIYNIVGGIVALFSFLNSAMSSATQRYLNFEMGRKNSEQLRKVFSISLTVHFTIAIIAIIFSETVGLWFVNTYLNLPQDRMDAVNWVYQFTILIFVVSIIQVPFNASIIAHEKMSFYACISIVEVILKLAIAFSLQLSGYDKLKSYSVLMCIVSFIIISIYITYCKRKFESCNYKYYSDKSLYKQLLSFSGWSLFGSAANVGVQQGISIFQNIFFGVTVNAAMGISNQVSIALYNFVSNFQTAFKPQLVKSYAANDKVYFLKLIIQSSKYSYFLLFIISLPVIINMEFLLKIWLTNAPYHSAQFCRLTIYFMLIDAISAPLWLSVQATGQIRNYQILMGTLISLNLPLIFILFKLGFPTETALIIRIIINLITYIVRIFYLKQKINLPAYLYFKEVILVSLFITILVIPLPLIIHHYLYSWYGFVLNTVVAIMSTFCAVYFIGLKNNEKKILLNILTNKILKGNR